MAGLEGRDHGLPGLRRQGGASLSQQLGGFDMETLLKVDAEQAQGPIPAEGGDARH